jgi:amidase
MNLAYASASTLARQLHDREIGALELFDLYAGRIERHNKAINAICTMDLEAGREAARAADAERGERGPLHGLPMTVKESFDLTGFATTWGLPQMKSNVASRDALAVQRLKRAGAVIFGKTNVPTLLADWQSFNPVYGATSNPWDVSRVPGGSSGGAAAALAAGLTGLEMGSDIGASIRAPAHYCGVYGHKPTWEICSSVGHALPGNVTPSDMAVIGPLARSAEDLRMALDIIAGPDEIDGAGWRLALDKPAAPASFTGLRIAVMLSHPTAEVDTSVTDQIEQLASFAASRGARVSDAARPDFDPAEAHRVYLSLLRSATSGGLSDEQFARWQAVAGQRSRDDSDYEAQAAYANTMFHREWLAVSNRRHQMRLAWAEFFREWDVLLCPTAASAAFHHNREGERWERMIPVNGKPQPSTTQMFWAGYSGVSLLPSTVAPIGFTSERLPVGVQIVGPQYGDYRTIGIAELIEREYHRFVPPEGYE